MIKKIIIVLSILSVCLSGCGGKNDNVVKLSNGQEANIETISEKPLLKEKDEYVNGEINRKTLYSYDEFDRVLEEKTYVFWPDLGKNDELWYSRTYTYERDGGYTLQEEYQNELQEVHIYKYNSNNELFYNENHNVDGDSVYDVVYTYKDDYKVWSYKNREGEEYNYATFEKCDEVGNVIAKGTSSDGENHMVYIENTYDDNNTIVRRDYIRIRDEDYDHEEYYYDDQGRKTKVETVSYSQKEPICKEVTSYTYNTETISEELTERFNMDDNLVWQHRIVYIY